MRTTDDLKCECGNILPPVTLLYGKRTIRYCEKCGRRYKQEATHEH